MTKASIVSPAVVVVAPDTHIPSAAKLVRNLLSESIFSFRFEIPNAFKDLQRRQQFGTKQMPTCTVNQLVNLLTFSDESNLTG